MQDEVRRIVNEMNDTIFMSSDEVQDYISYLELTEPPIGDYIKFSGHYIWDSENDFRDYIVDGETGEDTTEEKEDLKQYLWEQISLIKHSIYRAMVAIEKSFPEGVEIG